MKCWIIFVPSPNALLLIYLTIGIFDNGGPHALIIKTKKINHKGERQHFEGLTFLPQI